MRLEDGTVLVLDAGTGVRSWGERSSGTVRRSTCSRISTSITSKGWASSPRSGSPGRCTSGARAHRSTRWPSGSRATSLRRSSRQGRGQSRRCTSTPFRPGPGRSAARRSAPARCCTRGRRWGTGSRKDRPRSRVHPRPRARARPRPRAGRPEWLPGYDVAAGATVLLHDAQLTEDEYAARSAGDTRRWTQPSRSRSRPAPNGWFSSTTIRCAATPRSSGWHPRAVAVAWRERLRPAAGVRGDADRRSVSSRSVPAEASRRSTKA